MAKKAQIPAGLLRGILSNLDVWDRLVRDQASVSQVAKADLRINAQVVKLQQAILNRYAITDSDVDAISGDDDTLRPAS